MDRETTEGIAPTDSATAVEDLERGIELYKQGDYTMSLYFLNEADKKFILQGGANPRVSERLMYFMYKAYVMSWDDPSREFDPRLNLTELEAVVQKSKNPVRHYAISAYNRFGRLGLLVHDFIEKHGWLYAKRP